MASTGTAVGGVVAYVSDSDFYATSGRETLLIASPDGTDKRTLRPAGRVDIGLLQFSPTGRRLAYFLATSSGSSVDVMDVATKKVESVLTLRGSSAYVDGLAWTPDGRDLVVGINERPGSSTAHTETALWRVPLGAGKATRLTTFDDAGDPVVMPDGDLVYVVSKTFSSSSLKPSVVWKSAPNGSHRVRIFSSTHFVDTPALSPNGHTLAFSVVVNNTTTYLESLTVTSRSRRELTSPVKGRTDISPSWSPNGTDIVFLSSRAGRHASKKSEQLLDAYVMTATGAHPTPIIARKGDKWSVVLVAWGS